MKTKFAGLLIAAGAAVLQAQTAQQAETGRALFQPDARVVMGRIWAAAKARSSLAPTSSPDGERGRRAS